MARRSRCCSTAHRRRRSGTSLPFAAQLATVETSAPVPVAVVATVGKRLDAGKWKELQTAFTSLKASDALAGIQMTGFAPLDEEALTAARTAFGKAR